MKLNEWGFRPPLCTCRLNWTRRTSWGWRDEWDDTAIQTQDSKFEPCRSEAVYATSRSRRLPTILNLYEWAGKKQFFFKLKARAGHAPAISCNMPMRIRSTNFWLKSWEVRHTRQKGNSRSLKIDKLVWNEQILSLFLTSKQQKLPNK